MGNTWCRIRLCALAYRQNGVAAAATYAYKKRWCNASTEPLRLMRAMNERVHAFETPDDDDNDSGGTGRRLLLTTPEHCETMERFLEHRSEYDYYYSHDVPFAVKVYTNLRTCHVYIPRNWLRPLLTKVDT